MPSFPYVSEKAGEGFLPRPKIPAIVSRGERRIKTLGLVDSGSDITIIPRRMAESLGITAAGRQFDIHGMRESTMMSTDFASIETGGAHLIGARVFFPSEELPESDEIVLGHDPLFREFNITFEYNAKRIILNKVRH